jgi:LuxR family transcriptional regulator, maltose regulon positive regulatory protein
MSIQKLVQLLNNEHSAGEWRVTRQTSPDTVLSPQELRIALETARGLSIREISATCLVSPKTAEHHLSRIYQKLQIRSRQQLAAMVIDHLLAHPESQTYSRPTRSESSPGA